MAKTKLKEKVAVVPCFSGPKCWCRMLVWESYKKMKTDKAKEKRVLINYGNTTKEEAEKVADVINEAVDIINKNKGK